MAVLNPFPESIAKRMAHLQRRKESESVTVMSPSDNESAESINHRQDHTLAERLVLEFGKVAESSLAQVRFGVGFF